MTPIRVLLVDDHAVVRMGFRLLLQTAKGLEVVDELASGEEAVLRYRKLEPDVVVMDLNMAGIGGIEATRRIVAHHPEARILALSAHADASHPTRAMKAGAMGYLCKRSAPEALIMAIQDVACGKRYIDAETAQLLVSQKIYGEGNPSDQLSSREFEIFLFLARGKSVQQIAEMLHLSPSTVGTHLYNIKSKLKASNLAELALIAVRHGLLDE